MTTYTSFYYLLRIESKFQPSSLKKKRNISRMEEKQLTTISYLNKKKRKINRIKGTKKPPKLIDIEWYGNGNEVNAKRMGRRVTRRNGRTTNECIFDSARLLMLAYEPRWLMELCDARRALMISSRNIRAAIIAEFPFVSIR